MNRDDAFRSMDLPSPSPAADKAPTAHASVDNTAPHPPLGQGINPLEVAAAPLLTLIAQLSQTLSQPDIPSLRRRLTQEVRQFEKRTQSLGVGEKMRLAGRYALCFTLDEVIANTPWGTEYGWQQQSLCKVFHGEPGSEQRLLQLQERFAQAPEEHLDALELIYLCLALGPQDQYRRLESERQELLALIQKTRGRPNPELSPHWRGIATLEGRPAAAFPLWAIVAVGLALWMGLHLLFNAQLQGRSDGLFAAVQPLGRQLDLPSRPQNAEVLTPQLGQTPLEVLRLKLSDNSCLALDQAGDITIIRTTCDTLFDAGRWSPTPALERLLVNIDDALAALPDHHVLITGHADNPSNHWISDVELSQRRAEVVMDSLINLGGTPGRFSAEGRGDWESLADEPDDEGHRQRVEFELIPPLGA
ncbi:MAG: type IVB secretion system protein IcmH/DotU [Candidatus Competibacterales bacterium]